MRIALALSLVLATTAPATAEPGVVAAHIVSRAGKGGSADDRPKRALRRDGVTLHAVLEVRDGNRVEYFSDASPEVIRYLLENGANKNARDSGERGAEEYLALSSLTDSQKTEVRTDLSRAP